MKKLFLLVPFVFALSCQKENYNHDVVTVKDARRIPIENALADLDRHISILYGPETKSTTRIYNKNSVLSVGKNELRRIATRSTDDSLPDTLFYVVNFNDNNGYAILAADTRLGESVYCITESGHLSADDFMQVYQREAVDDTTHADTGENQTSPGYWHGPALPIIVDDAIDDYKREEKEVSEDPYQNSPVKYGPYLKTKWHQRSPFNDAQDNEYPAGCTAIATAQVILSNKQSSTMVFNGVKCDWDIMESVCHYSDPYYSGDKLAQNQVANFVFEIGKKHNCNVLYGNQSFAFVKGAARTLENFGYHNVNKYESYRDKVVVEIKKCLCNGKSVIMCGVDDFKSAHTWVIDGLYDNMYHINWGWNGNADGWFAQGIFNTEERRDIENNFDSGATVVENEHYNWLFRVVTYDL